MTQVQHEQLSEFLRKTIPIEFAPGKPIYERQPKERDRMWRGFEVYLNLGALRTYDKVATQMEVSRMSVSKWSLKWRWRERAKAWEIKQDEEFQLERMDSAKAMLRRQITMGDNLSVRAYNVLLSQFYVGEDGSPRSNFTNAELLKILQFATELHRRSLGIPDRFEGMLHHNVNVNGDDPPVPITGTVIEADPMVEKASRYLDIVRQAVDNRKYDGRDPTIIDMQALPAGQEDENGSDC